MGKQTNIYGNKHLESCFPLNNQKEDRPLPMPTNEPTIKPNWRQNWSHCTHFYSACLGPNVTVSELKPICAQILSSLLACSEYI